MEAFLFEFLQYLRRDRIGVFNHRHMQRGDVVPEGVQRAQQRSRKVAMTSYDRVQIQQHFACADVLSEKKEKNE